MHRSAHSARWTGSDWLRVAMHRYAPCLRGSGGAALVFLLVLPLTVPALIFGTGAVVAVDSGLSAQAHFSLLGALLIFTLLGAPLAAASALRISLD